MGDSLVQWRSAIGCFLPSRSRRQRCATKDRNNICSEMLSLFLKLGLIIIVVSASGLVNSEQKMCFKDYQVGIKGLG